MPRIRILGPKGDEHELVLSGPVYLGRHRDCDIVLADSKVSRRHARFIPVGRSYIIEDLGSANGTLLNGARIERRVLANGDNVEIGPFRIRYTGEPGEDLVGQIVEGYRIIRRIGTGGMGSVYLAEQLSMGRLVALKLLNAELAEDPDFIEDFINEARLAGRLNHPNIVGVFDFGSFQSTYFISMEYVDGRPVREILAEKGRFEPLEALQMLLPVAEALEHAHAHRVIHQDIKPQNIMLSKDGQVKLADLGLARRAGGGPDDRHQKVIVGTPHYMSPEQGRRQPADARSDIYSFGATLFHMVTGRVPFDGPNSLAIITKHLHQEPPSPKRFDLTLPESLCNLVLRCLQKESAARYQSASELVAALQAVAKDVAAHKRQRELRRRAASGALSRRETVQARRPQAPLAGRQLLLPIVIAGVVVFLGLCLALAGRSKPTGSQGAAEPARELLRNARNRLDAGLLKDAETLARRALDLTNNNLYRQEANSILSQVARLIENRAQEDLVLIEDLYRKNPLEARRFLVDFVRQHEGTQAAAKARELLRSEEPAATTDTGASGTQQLPAESAAAVMAQARQAAEKGDYVKALGLLESRPGTIAADEQAQFKSLMDTLRVQAAEEARRSLDAAERALAAGVLAEALAALRRAEAAAIEPAERQKLAALQKQAANAGDAYIAASEREIAELLSSYRFTEAAGHAEVAVGAIGETASENLRSLKRIAELAADGFRGLLEAVNASPGRAFEAALKGNPPGWLEAAAADAKQLTVRFRNSGKSLQLAWPDVPPEALTALIFAYGARTDNTASAALLATRGGKEAALKLLGTRTDADAQLLRVFLAPRGERSRRLEFRDIASLPLWRTPKGRWMLRDGMLHEESGEEALLEYIEPLRTGAGGILKMRVNLLTGGGKGYVSAELRSLSVRGVLYLDEEGGRFCTSAGGSEEAYRIERPKTPGAHTLAIEMDRESLSARIDDYAFPARKIFGLGASEYNLSIGGMGEAFAVVSIEIERR